MVYQQNERGTKNVKLKHKVYRDHHALNLHPSDTSHTKDHQHKVRTQINYIETI